jgi:hypothetical protein
MKPRKPNARRTGFPVAWLMVAAALVITGTTDLGLFEAPALITTLGAYLIVVSGRDATRLRLAVLVTALGALSLPLALAATAGPAAGVALILYVVVLGVALAGLGLGGALAIAELWRSRRAS